MHNDYIAAMKIQSIVRMFLVRKHLRNEEINRKANRNTLLEDVIKNKGGKPKSILSTSRYFKHHEAQCRKEINILTNICKNPWTDEHNIKKILYIFFEICSNNKRYLSRTEFTVLICDILRLPITKNEVINYLLSSKDFMNNGMIDYHQLCKWYLSYRQKHLHDRISCIKKVFESWFIDPLPVNIILNYLDIRAMLYDACISLMVFDSKNIGYSFTKLC